MEVTKYWRESTAIDEFPKRRVDVAYGIRHHGVDRSHRTPRDPRSQPPAKAAQRDLEQDRAEQHASDRDSYLRPAAGHMRAHRLRDLGADKRAAEETDERDRAYDRAVAKSRNCVQYRHRNDDPVDDRHGGIRSAARRACPSGPALDGLCRRIRIVRARES